MRLRLVEDLRARWGTGVILRFLLVIGNRIVTQSASRTRTPSRSPQDTLRGVARRRNPFRTRRALGPFKVSSVNGEGCLPRVSGSKRNREDDHDEKRSRRNIPIAVPSGPGLVAQVAEPAAGKPNATLCRGPKL